MANEAVNVDLPDLPDASNRDESCRVSRIGKVLAVGTLVAGSAIAGVNVGVPNDHAAHQPAVALTTEVRTLRGVIPWSIDTGLKGVVCNKASHNTCTTLVYPEIFGDLGVAWGTSILEDALRSTSTRKIIFGYSSGAVVASQWLAKHATEADAPSASNLSFILMGNPKRKYGGASWAYASNATTPSTKYTLLDVAREYDNVADATFDPWNFFALLNSMAAYYVVHPAYGDVDLVKDEKLVWKEGNTTYVLIRTKDLPLLAPMLAPLRFFGLNFVADAINAPLKALVDAAYNRNYPGIITDPVAAQKAVDDALHGVPASTPAPTSAKLAPTTFGAATLVALDSVENPSEPTGSKTTPAVTKSLSRDVAETKTVAAEDVKADPSDDAPAAAQSSAADPDTTTDSDDTTAAPANKQPQVDPSETSDTGADNSESLGRHRAPENAASTTSDTGADNAESVGRHRAPEDAGSAPAENP